MFYNFVRKIDWEYSDNSAKDSQGVLTYHFTLTNWYIKIINRNNVKNKQNQ